jgi:hypothetical protein
LFGFFFFLWSEKLNILYFFYIFVLLIIV